MSAYELGVRDAAGNLGINLLATRVEPWIRIGVVARLIVKHVLLRNLRVSVHASSRWVVSLGLLRRNDVNRFVRG